MFDKLKNKLKKIQLSNNSHAEVNKEDGIVRVIKDDYVSGKDNVEMLEYMSEQNELPIFKGEIEHAYESTFLGYTDKCPRCESETEQMMSNFPYATQGPSRILTAPVGFFCSNCPTVIIDDEIAKSAIKHGVEYCGVFSIETGYSTQPTLFKTLNGEKAIYILSEEQDVLGIAQSVHHIPSDDYMYLPSRGKRNTLPQAQRKKNKKRNKAARKSRKRNRKK